MRVFQYILDLIANIQRPGERSNLRLIRITPCRIINRENSDLGEGLLLDKMTHAWEEDWSELESQVQV